MRRYLMLVAAFALALSLLAPAAGSARRTSNPYACQNGNWKLAIKKVRGKRSRVRPTARDVDADGIPNARDRDVDGDRRPNKRDRDVDGDGKPNKRDCDVDGDRIPNSRDRDVDGDGIPNSRDHDIDGDGIPNGRDPDMDGDGKPNWKDSDSDGDGVADTEDDSIGGRPYGAGRGTNPPVGISDQRAGTFSDPLFAGLGNLRTARLITAWNTPPEQVAAWMDAARARGIRPLVAFNHSEGDRCEVEGASCYAPSEAEYAAAFRAFRAAYPWVTEYQPWNEVNHATQPTGRRPELAALYYNVARRECPACTILAADLLDAPNLESYAKAFLKKAQGTPRLWGLHNYSDTNRFRTSGTDTLLATVEGEVWLTETGGVVSFTTSKGENALPYDEDRARRSMEFLFDRLVAPNSARIRRVYVYQWKKTNSDDRFDAGIVGLEGTPRASYGVVRDAVGRQDLSGLGG